MSYSCPPRTIEAGTTVTFASGRYPSSTYSLQVALNNGKDAPLIVDATASGTGFAIEFEAPTIPGTYVYGEVYTKTADGTTYAGRRETIEVTPSILAQATPSLAQRNLTALQLAYETRGASGRVSVSFNGQSATWMSLAEIREEITFWQAKVLAEQAAFTGRNLTGSIAPCFVSPESRYPFR